MAPGWLMLKTTIGKLVGLAQPERVGVHDGVVLDDRFLVGELGNERGRRVRPRIAGEDPVHVGGLEDHFGLDLERPEHAGGVGGEERVAGAGGEDDEPALLQVADGAAPDVGLGQRLHPDGRHDPGVHADLLQHVLQRQGVDDRGQHAHVVGGDAVEPFPAGRGAADDVAAAHHQREVHAEGVHRLDLFRERLDDVKVEARAFLAAQRLARNLEQGAGVGEGHQAAPTWNRANRRTVTTSPSLPDDLLHQIAHGLLVVLARRAARAACARRRTS